MKRFVLFFVSKSLSKQDVKVQSRQQARCSDKSRAKDRQGRFQQARLDFFFFFFFFFLLFQDNATTKRLKMYSAKPQRDRAGNVTSGQYMSKETDKGAGRVMADRRWFGNTRVIGQNELETFREELGRARENPYQVVLGERKLPTSLLQTDDGKKEGKRERKAHVTEVEPFELTFGVKATRKRPKLAQADVAALAVGAGARSEAFEDDLLAHKGEDDGTSLLQVLPKDPIFL
jgi:hypothetical protein